MCILKKNKTCSLKRDTTSAKCCNSRECEVFLLRPPSLSHQ